MRAIALLLALMQSPQPTPPGSATPALDPIKFGLSEVEGLKLENLRLRRDLLQLQIKMAQDALSVDLQGFISETLKSHGSPSNVVFDPQSFTFKIQPAENKPDKN